MIALESNFYGSVDNDAADVVKRLVMEKENIIMLTNLRMEWTKVVLKMSVI